MIHENMQKSTSWFPGKRSLVGATRNPGKYNCMSPASSFTNRYMDNVWLRPVSIGFDPVLKSTALQCFLFYSHDTSLILERANSFSGEPSSEFS